MNISRFLLPLLIVVALYVVLIRPQRNRQRAAQQLTNTITAGQRIVTTAGMYATVVEVDDNGVLLEIAPGVEVRYVRQAISRVVEDEYVPEVGAVEGEYADDEYADDDDEYADPDETDETTDQTGDDVGEEPLDDDPDRPRAGATAIDLSKTDVSNTSSSSTELSQDGARSDLDPADPALR